MRKHKLSLFILNQENKDISPRPKYLTLLYKYAIIYIVYISMLLFTTIRRYYA